MHCKCGSVLYYIFQVLLVAVGGGMNVFHTDQRNKLIKHLLFLTTLETILSGSGTKDDALLPIPTCDIHIGLTFFPLLFNKGNSH